LIVVVVRHGAAENQEPRPLSAAGRRDVERLGRVLAALEVRPASFEHSPKLRARETAEILARALGPGAQALVLRDELGGDEDPQPLVDDLERRAKARGPDCLLAGHLPQVERLLALLLAGTEARPCVAFAPATAAVLDRSAAGWRLLALLPPAALQAAEP